VKHRVAVERGGDVLISGDPVKRLAITPDLISAPSAASSLPGSSRRPLSASGWLRALACATASAA
jgi:hypothetical protein